MDKQNKILIIGGTACGSKAAARARRLDPLAQITLIEERRQITTASCGLPYYVSGVVKNRSDLITRGNVYFKDVLDVRVITQTRAVGIDRTAHKVTMLNLEDGNHSNLQYDKLVLATGSVPTAPDLDGKKLVGVFTLTSIRDATAILDMVTQNKPRKATVIGAGPIGLEMVEAFASLGMDVTLIEALDCVLSTLIDPEVAALIQKLLRNKGVRLLLRQCVMGLEGAKNGAVQRVVTSEGAVDTDLVLLATGIKPNIDLARDAGIEIGARGGILVDSYLKTNDENTYAGGDCVENVDLITGQRILSPMGSTANKHGRVIGTNVTGGHETFPGVLGTTIVKVFDYNVARVGLTEWQAREAGYEVVSCIVPDYEHARYYPDGKTIVVKLVAESATGKVLGGQVVGKGEVAKRIDVLATALSFGASIADIANLDLAYAPPYNSAMDPLHVAAHVIDNKESGYARSLTPTAVKNKLDNDEDFILMDVRSPDEWKSSRIHTRVTKLIPLMELRSKLSSISREAEIVIYCTTGLRAYQAQRMLESAGFNKVTFMEGSLEAWPHEISTSKTED